MKHKRRAFVKNVLIAGAGIGMLPSNANATIFNNNNKTVRVGLVGVGTRGQTLARNLLTIEGVEITTICDIEQERLKETSALCIQKGYKKPKEYGDNEYSWKKLLDNETIDAVIIATPWEWHAQIGIHAMERGISPGIEVPAALTVKECWDLVDTSEDTGVPCMMLENWSFRPDNLAVLNMIRKGLFGEIVHSHCAHSHDVMYWFTKKKWPMKYLRSHNCDLYPTHQLGPILSWMNINCGDSFDYITSTATGTFGPPDYFERNYGSNHPMANKSNYSQGDIVTTVIRTKKGKTIVSNYDMQLPRPYDNRWMVQGTRGLYSECKKSVYIDENPASGGEKWKPFEPFLKKYKHKWSEYEGETHGGADRIMLYQFINAIRHNLPAPLDVYDSMTMSVIFELSGQSIKNGSKPIKVPDFTRGKWEIHKPYFGL